MGNCIKVLSEEKQRIAEEARQAASEIIQDAIDKKCYGLPVTYSNTCSDPVDSYTFCCIPTKEFLQDLLAKLSEARFMEDKKPGKCDTFAYVIPQNKDVIIYLCKQFWKAGDTLCEDSKPGTLIHEVSHLLGTEDIFYEHMTVELYEAYGILMGKSKCVKDLHGKGHREEVFQVNANSLEHEFETIINHKGAYSDGKYQCCGETKKNSVCTHNSADHYGLHERFPSQRDEMQRKLEKFWQEASARLNQKQKIKYVKKKNKACEKIPVSEA
ncbi:hypothetical protein AMEX_G3858 [Astyanax mexicanus]|uniref:Lysine-specific metallo-endopeptidase domain-containing protein n=1 Tax=Astyanax mexicanus TaxID=7994 RepID=A0A8T2M9B9_ASTMX|nr:hypothetical protein AMEX_G3858 [Astyanax mexicanus]